MEQQKYRPFDGVGNNLEHPTWGAANSKLLRKAKSDYKDGISSLAERGTTNPNPRVISNGDLAGKSL